jgi:hypothetical protein
MQIMASCLLITAENHTKVKRSSTRSRLGVTDPPHALPRYVEYATKNASEYCPKEDTRQ